MEANKVNGKDGLGVAKSTPDHSPSQHDHPCPNDLLIFQPQGR